MTEPERAALDHIRRVVDSVIGVPAPAEPTPTIPPPPGTNVSILPVPFIPQMSNEAGQFSNDSGTSAGVMLGRAYGDETITPADFYNQAGQGADNPLSFTQIMKALGVIGVPVELRSNLKLADLLLILFSGRPVIAPIQQAVLQNEGLTPKTFDGTYYVVVVGMDLKQIFIHDPLQKDSSGQSQGLSWLKFYQAWSQAQGYVRAVLVPRQQLIRRVCVSSNLLDIYEQPGGADATTAGKASFGEVFEVTEQKNGWGKIGEDRWINLSLTTDI
jgi:hypothetical protein